MKRVAWLVLLAACADSPEQRPDTIVGPAFDLVASSVESEQAWECVISAYPDTAMMGQAWDACVGPRSTPPPPPPSSALRVLLIGYSTAGQIVHQIDLENNPSMTAMGLTYPHPWGYGDCVTTPAGYVPSFMAPGPHTFQFSRQPPACLGGTGKGVTRVWGDPVWSTDGVSYDALWAHADSIVSLYGTPTHVWWWVADHKSAPATTAHVDHVYQQIKARWPSAVIVVNDVTQQIGQGLGCNVLAQSAWPNSQTLRAYALTLPGTIPGPDLTPIDPAHLSSDRCHYSATGLEQGPQGAEAIAWWGSQ